MAVHNRDLASYLGGPQRLGQRPTAHGLVPVSQTWNSHGRHSQIRPSVHPWQRSPPAQPAQPAQPVNPDNSQDEAAHRDETSTRFCARSFDNTIDLTRTSALVAGHGFPFALPGSEIPFHVSNHGQVEPSSSLPTATWAIMTGKQHENRVTTILDISTSLPSSFYGLATMAL